MMVYILIGLGAILIITGAALILSRPSRRALLEPPAGLAAAPEPIGPAAEPAEAPPASLLDEVAPPVAQQVDEEVASTTEGSVADVEAALDVELLPIPEASPETAARTDGAPAGLAGVPRPEGGAATALPRKGKKLKRHRGGHRPSAGPIEQLEELEKGVAAGPDEEEDAAGDEWIKELESLQLDQSPAAGGRANAGAGSPSELDAALADLENIALVEETGELDLQLGSGDLGLDTGLGDLDLDLEIDSPAEPVLEGETRPGAGAGTRPAAPESRADEGGGLDLGDLELLSDEPLANLDLSELEVAVPKAGAGADDEDWFKDVVEEVEREDAPPQLVEPAPEPVAPAPLPPAGGADDRRVERAKRLARVIVNDIKLYYPEKLELGIRQGNILQVLDDEIRRGRRLFLERAPTDIPGRERFYEDSLLEILASGNAEVLGRST